MNCKWTLVAMFLVAGGTQLAECVQPCVWTYNERVAPGAPPVLKKIDMSPLSLERIGAVNVDSEGFLFSWQPCKTFTSGPCAGDELCRKKGSAVQKLGRQPILFTRSGELLYLEFRVHDQTGEVVTEIEMACDQGGPRGGILVMGTDHDPARRETTYHLRFLSKYACPRDLNDHVQ